MFGEIKMFIAYRYRAMIGPVSLIPRIRRRLHSAPVPSSHRLHHSGAVCHFSLPVSVKPCPVFVTVLVRCSETAVNYMYTHAMVDLLS